MFCNLNGIKTKLFKKKNKNKNYPKYYLNPVINKLGGIKKKRTKKININYSPEKISHHKTVDFRRKKMKNNLGFDEDVDSKNKKFCKSSAFQNSSFSFYNNNNDEMKLNDENDKEKEDILPYTSSKKKNNGYKIIISNMKENSNKDNHSLFNNSKVKNSKDNSNNSLINTSKIKSSKYNNNSLISNSKLNSNKENNNSLMDDSKINNNKENNNNDREKEKDNELDKNENESNFDFIVNDEIHSNESFNIKIYDDEKPKSNQNNIQKIIPDNIYINNLNINYLGMPLEKKDENPKKIEKKIFKDLEISSNSTLEINSSYENINEITANKYINYYEFRKEIKEFLIEKSKQYDTKKAFNKYMFKSKPMTNKFLKANNNSRIYKSSISNNKFLLFNKKSFDRQDKSIRKTSTNKMNNKFSYESFQNFQNILMKSEKYNNKLLKINSSNTFDLSELKSMEDANEPINDTGNNNFNFKRKKNLIKSVDTKKKRKLNELDIITSNIQKTSQNLNQPSEFYAGLFSNLISKDYPQLKEPPPIFKSRSNLNNILEKAESKKTITKK